MGHDKSASTKEMSSDARKEEKRAHKKRKRGADGERERKSKSRRVTDDEEEVALSTAAPFKLQSNRSSDAAAESSYALENEITVHMPPSSKPLYPVMDFNQLDIAETLQPSLKTFARPTPIQAYTWPALVESYDVVGVAETGSGKTLAFGLPALNRAIACSSGIPVLVVAPTRELAIQTHDTLKVISAAFGVESVCVFGGVSKNDQIRLLQSPNVRFLVGTPGRLLDLAQDGACDLSKISYLVLDEADRMLDKGFENDIRTIIGLTPADGRQTVMFSATWPTSVRKLAETFLRNPVRVVVGTDELSLNRRVQQEVQVIDDPRTKQKRLSHLLRTVVREGMKKIIVFVLYKKEASRIEDTIRQFGYTVAGLHGDLSQDQRLAALSSFKEGRNLILVATDVAARGLDIPNVELVVNYTFPLTIEDYVHRIGRTGRGGKSGRAVTFFSGENHERALAGELARVVREGGYEAKELNEKFPMTVKKKQHAAYGSFFREETAMPAAQKIRF